ncbi:Ca2:Cation Antiporter family [Thecamonas trahens ATCC 50062]|uniref:Ca2:Cation Antiporter family n=1 Tax=Thecamonas trahens ATCC 50062 TaxID=461836 RepID=A0A0L0DLR6_THETB|nr:Ca2:Cation Antiporter family [Thecamonas trahens ATCC 50062]KNC52338.1 Ca2:Cation Antiporter family [Thecamonas trahens ATCC 50062]|eukprot:XP_013755388.1 Ca2:Cation Antiporter family [Thecamonas trahens ATCC 50062]
MGIGTIVGSAVFNLLVIIGASAVAAGSALALSPKVLLRDMVVNVLAFGYLMAIFSDAAISWWEAAIGLVLYAIYLTCLLASASIASLTLALAPTACAWLEPYAHQSPAPGSLAAAAMAATDGDGRRAERARLLSLADEEENEMWSDGPALRPRLDSWGGDGLLTDDAIDEARAFPLLPPSLDALWTDNVDGDGECDEQEQQEEEADESSGSNNGEIDPVARFGSVFAAAARASTPPPPLRSAPVGRLEEPSLDVLYFGEDFDGELGLSDDVAEAGRPPRLSNLAVYADSESSNESTSPDLGGYSRTRESEQLRVARRRCEGALTAVVWTPLEHLFRYTIPPPRGNLVVLTFLCSFAWLALMIYGVSAFAARIGCMLHISQETLGLTALAIGTSMPDALSSVFVARQGHGTMCVSNAMGSNVFDILVALALPWFLSALMGDPVVVNTSDMRVFALFFFASLALVVAVLAAARWRLHWVGGAVLLAAYGGFAAFVVVRPDRE